MKLFDEETIFKKVAPYAPDKKKTLEDQATQISGRHLEESVELHIESGGTAISAMAHVIDAIANESLKKFKKKEVSGGLNQDCYPSTIHKGYNRSAVVEELCDVFFLLSVNMLVSEVNYSELLEGLDRKIKKLEQAQKEGRLIRTSNGNFYIKKD